MKLTACALVLLLSVPTLATAGTEDPAATSRLWRGFAEEAKADPSPPTWSYLLLDTHPSMAKRVAMAEAWRERRAGD